MENRELSSFRDPAGYVYYENDKIYRKINKVYFKEYNHMLDSGLYKELLSKGYVVNYKEVSKNKDSITIEVQKIPFISYPYEWCFNELKDAALLTLKIQKEALLHGMYLKDASSYNVQFYNGKAIFIDTLSFGIYEEGEPWGAYGQFCRHFMGPLLLMRYVDERANCLLKNYIDGIPVDLIDNILKNRGGFVARQHIKWHAKSISRNNDNDKVKVSKVKMSKNSVINMIDMMIRQIEKLSRVKVDSEWGNYYENTNYSDVSDNDKINIVSDYYKEIKIKKYDVVWDLGANDGKFSRVASLYCDNVVSFDIDVNAVNRNYNIVNKENKCNILPLILDLTNPTPAIGFGCCERGSLNDRGNIKCVMALALIHHIAISNNVPFIQIADWFSKLGEYLIIEFVPKDDSKVEKLLRTRNDIFDNYNIDSFEVDFSKYYKIINKKKLKDSKRVMYLMRRCVEDEK